MEEEDEGMKGGQEEAEEDPGEAMQELEEETREVKRETREDDEGDGDRQKPKKNEGVSLYMKLWRQRGHHDCKK